MMKKLGLLSAAALLRVTVSITAPGFAQNAPVKHIVLVHGAWVDGSGWNPVYDILIKADRVINPDLEHGYAKRASSHTTEIAGASHSVYESRPSEVAAVIEEAAHEVSKETVGSRT